MFSPRAKTTSPTVRGIDAYRSGYANICKCFPINNNEQRKRKKKYYRFPFIYLQHQSYLRMHRSRFMGGWVRVLNNSSFSIPGPPRFAIDSDGGFMIPLGRLSGSRNAGRVKSIANQPLSEENLLIYYSGKSTVVCFRRFLYQFFQFGTATCWYWTKFKFFHIVLECILLLKNHNPVCWYTDSFLCPTPNREER